MLLITYWIVTSVQIVTTVTSIQIVTIVAIVTIATIAYLVLKEEDNVGMYHTVSAVGVSHPKVFVYELRHSEHDQRSNQSRNKDSY